MRNDTAFMDRIHSYIAGWDIPKLSPLEHFTDHFGLVSDFLSECWHRQRMQGRGGAFQNRVFWGGALSGRDITAVQKTVAGLLKLVSPNPEVEVPEEDLEWAVRLALECRRRVKEQQKRIGSAEFRNTHFSYHLGTEGVEKFVATPELQSEDKIGTDPLPPGQIWTIGPGGADEHPGLLRIDVTVGPGSGVRILNAPTPPPFRESVKYAEQNLYARAKELVGDRDPRSHEFSVQLRAFDSAKTGAATGLGAMLALCSALLQKSMRGGLIVAGQLNLGGSIDPIHNAVAIAELAVEKGATTLLVPISARRQLMGLSDEMAARLSVQFYVDGRDALLKGMLE
jgi:ATP-dependent Lon protease